MNRLGFADFHSKHFSPEQKLHWQSMLQQQQQQQQQYNVDLQYYEQEHEQPTEYYQEEEGYYQEEQVDPEEELSKEAIEIFRFSEAYRKEREMERIKEEEIDQDGMEDWQYQESRVTISGGMEAPATSLVLINKSDALSENIKIQECLLNSAYLSSCQDNGDHPVVLWPVLPFNM
jgi:hypothetical protein